MTTYNIYQRETLDQTPVQIVTGLTSKNHAISSLTKGKKYLFSVGSVKNGLEKISDERLILAGVAWTPQNLANIPKVLIESQNTSSSMALVSEVFNSGQLGSSFTQNTETKKPKLLDEAIVFDGVDDYVDSTNLRSILNSQSKYNVFCTLSKNKLDTVGVSEYVIAIPSGSNALRMAIRVGDEADANALSFALRAADSGAALKFNAVDSMILNRTYMLLCSIDLATKTLKFTVDGVGLPAISLSSLASSVSNTSSSQSFRLGGASWNSTGGNAPASLYCSIIQTGDLPTQSEIDKLFGWAAHRYGLTDNLPIDHPYKTLTPVL